MNVTSYPLLVCVISFVVLAISARLGVLVSQRRCILGDVREDVGVIQAATLTLLGLIIGFTSADTEFKFSTPNPPGIPSPNKIETRFGTLAFEFTPTPSLPRRSDGKFIGDF